MVTPLSGARRAGMRRQRSISLPDLWLPASKNRQRVYLVSQKLDPDGTRRRWRIDVDDGAPLRELPLLPHEGRRLVARGGKIVDELLLKKGLPKLHFEGIPHEEGRRKERVIQGREGKKAYEARHPRPSGRGRRSSSTRLPFRRSSGCKRENRRPPSLQRTRSLP